MLARRSSPAHGGSPADGSSQLPLRFVQCGNGMSMGFGARWWRDIGGADSEPRMANRWPRRPGQKFGGGYLGRWGSGEAHAAEQREPACQNQRSAILKRSTGSDPRYPGTIRRPCGRLPPCSPWSSALPPCESKAQRITQSHGMCRPGSAPRVAPHHGPCVGD
jgi:hypothetical protein